MGLITCLGRNQLPQPESYWTLLTIALKMGKDRGNSILGRVRLHTYTHAWMKMSKDHCTAKGLFQPCEGLRSCCSPLPLGLSMRHLATIAWLGGVGLVRGCALCVTMLRLPSMSVRGRSTTVPPALSPCWSVRLSELALPPLLCSCRSVRGQVSVMPLLPR
jgi:hypothetical protein